MIQRLSGILDKIVHPVAMEFPFFVMIILLNCYRAIYMLLFHFPMWLYESDFPRLRIIGISIVYSYILTIVVYYSKCKWIKALIYFVFIFLLCVNLYLLIAFNAGILLSTMLLLFETNKNEVQDFTMAYLFSRSGLITLGSLLFVSFFVYIAEKLKSLFIKGWFRVPEFIHNIISVFLLLCLACGIYSFHIYYDLFKCDNTDETDVWSYKVNTILLDQITNCVFTSYDLYLTGQNLAIAEKSTYKSCGNYISINNGFDSTNVVLVIGESFIKQKSSLYGYPLKTNPRLELEFRNGNLFIFNDVVSPFIYTSDAVRNMLSTNSVGDNEKWYEHPFFPALFKQAGYYVSFWDNQYSTSEGPFDFTLNAYIHSNKIAKISYDQVNGFISNYDGDMVDEFVDNLTNMSRNPSHFVIFHLQGQHTLPESHYPQNSEFTVFSSDSINNRNEGWIDKRIKTDLAHYDNCTLYNDFVISRIISLFRNKSSVLVYLSDHGENQYDLGNYRGRRITDVTNKGRKGLHALLDVPFMIWCSDKYRESHPDLIYAIKKAVNKPMMTDNLCHLLMRVGGGML